MALPGLCLELSFNVLYCRTQPIPPTLKQRESLCTSPTQRVASYLCQFWSCTKCLHFVAAWSWVRVMDRRTFGYFTWLDCWASSRFRLSAHCGLAEINSVPSNMGNFTWAIKTRILFLALLHKDSSNDLFFLKSIFQFIYDKFKAGPLEAILVIFGRRALIFFVWKLLGKMKNDATFVRMRGGDHLGDAKMSKKGTSVRRI